MNVNAQPSAPQPLVRRLAAPLSALAGAAAAFTYVGAVDPNRPGHYPVCPLLLTTGLYCPGCGGLRAAHAVAHGDLVGAFDLNALAVLSFLAFAAVVAVWLYRAARGRPARIALQPVHWRLLTVLALAFTVARNLSAGALMAP